MNQPIGTDAIRTLFLDARTHNVWSDRPVSEDLIRDLYDLVKMGPTSANTCPARFVWVRSSEGKQRLSRLAMGANQPKILAAPVTVIIGYDLDFADRLPQLFPARAEELMARFKSAPLAEPTAFRNSTLQGAYLILAARALGLDTGPMSGFNNAAVDAEFFAGTAIKSNFICSVGYGMEEHLLPRLPRLSFADACSFA